MKKQVLDSISAYVNKGSKAGSGSSGGSSGSNSGSGGSVEIEVNDSNFNQLV